MNKMQLRCHNNEDQVLISVKICSFTVALEMISLPLAQSEIMTDTHPHTLNTPTLTAVTFVILPFSAVVSVNQPVQVCFTSAGMKPEGSGSGGMWRRIECGY